MLDETAIRNAIFDRQRMRWSKITATPGFLGRVVQTIFGKNPAEAFYIVEHEAADPESGECAGDVLAAWRLDHQGLREVDPNSVDPGRLIKNRMWQHQMVHMFISDDGQHVFLNEMDGPEWGTILWMKPKQSTEGLKLKVVRAAPVLGGVAVG